MKVILYMATSVNGYIAKLNHDTPWSDDEFISYSDKVKEVGNLIIGKTTYDLMLKENAFVDLNEPFIAVLTSSSQKPTRGKTVFVKNFKDSLKALEKQGFQIALVGGGGQADTAALESGLLEEIFIDVEPLVFGRGIPLFATSNSDLKLKLLDTKKIGNSGLQLHYQVIR
jgi:dihydrofolate reductase